MQISPLCVGEYPTKIKVKILNTDDTLINSTITQPVINDQLLILRGYASLKLPETVNILIVNVSLSNNGGEFKNISSFRFGKNHFCWPFIIISLL